MSIKFDPTRHIKSIAHDDWIALKHSDGHDMEGIRGIAGVWENEELHGHEMGVDRIHMDAGRRFNLHTHPGAHILIVIEGWVKVHIDGTDYRVDAGDTIYIPADYVHGVRNDHANAVDAEFLAFGYPHMPIDSHLRMHEVADH